MRLLVKLAPDAFAPDLSATFVRDAAHSFLRTRSRHINLICASRVIATPRPASSLGCPIESTWLRAQSLTRFLAYIACISFRAFRVFGTHVVVNHANRHTDPARFRIRNRPAVAWLNSSSSLCLSERPTPSPTRRSGCRGCFRIPAGRPVKGGENFRSSPASVKFRGAQNPIGHTNHSENSTCAPSSILHAARGRRHLHA